MYNNYDLGVVIPVGLGNERAKKTALLPVGPEQISLLAWKIRQIKKVISPHKIYVSTEADELKKIAISESVNVHHREDCDIAGGESSFSSVIVNVVKDIPHEHIAWVTCVVPLMNPQEYLQGFTEYKDFVLSEHSESDSLMSVNVLKEYLWNDHGPLNYEANKKHIKSSELENSYRVTNGLYMCSKETILAREYFLGESPYKSCVSKIAGIDIEDYEGYEIARDLIGLYDQNEDRHLKDKMVFLDFDGVIFDSAKEAYAIAVVTAGLYPTIDDVDFESEHSKRFLSQRYLIGPAWNYYYLLKAIAADVDSSFASYLPEQPGNEAREFMISFFATRKIIRNSNWDNWLNLNKLYKGSNGFLELIEEYDNVSIVTTKDKETVRALLSNYGVTRDVAIYDTVDYEKYGCKSSLIHELIKEGSINHSVFIDDSEKHLAKCSWVKNLDLLHARWGYVSPEKYADNKHDILNHITSLLRG